MNKLAACTIITKKYLPYARTLADSLSEHNPDVKLYVLLADKVDGHFDPSLEAFDFIYLEDLSDQEAIQRMCFYYTAFELCCALRGLLHEYMLEKTDAQKWVFLDSDIMVFGSFDPISEQLESSSILLSPHSITPVPRDFVDPCEINFIKNGLYNGGFLGLRRSDAAREFISWFKFRLQNFCFNDYSGEELAILARGLFVDQLWLDMVPLYFDKVGLCLEPGANLGHWNLYDKILSKDNQGNFTVNGKPILFVHFSGWDIHASDQLSKYAPMLMYKEIETNPSWLEMSAMYRDSLLKNGYEDLADLPYAFNYFNNGAPINHAMRRQYYNHLVAQGEYSEMVPFSDKMHAHFSLLAKQQSRFSLFIRRISRRFNPR